MSLWLIAMLLSLDWHDVRDQVLTPAGALPVALFLFGVARMAGPDVSLLERWKGLNGFVKLLVILLLMAHVCRSGAGMRVFLAFLLTGSILLLAPFAVAILPNLPKGSSDFGVLVKSYCARRRIYALRSRSALSGHRCRFRATVGQGGGIARHVMRVF